MNSQIILNKIQQTACTTFQAVLSLTRRDIFYDRFPSFKHFPFLKSETHFNEEDSACIDKKTGDAK
jgi:hypothetical protein